MFLFWGRGRGGGGGRGGGTGVWGRASMGGADGDVGVDEVQVDVGHGADDRV